MAAKFFEKKELRQLVTFFESARIAAAACRHGATKLVKKVRRSAASQGPSTGMATSESHEFSAAQLGEDSRAQVRNGESPE
eukprot:gene4062-14151_t